MRRTGLILLIAAAIAGVHDLSARFEKTPSVSVAPADSGLAGPAETARDAGESIVGRLAARLLADGLLRGYGWRATECSEEVSVVLRSADSSYSFCYVYDSDQPSTLIALETIFREHSFEWEELGWTPLVEGMGGVYKSTLAEDRYVIIIVGGHPDSTGSGSTRVIVSVANGGR